MGFELFDLLHGRTSSDGDVKQQFIDNSMLFAAHFENQPKLPSYRFTWEKLVAESTQHTERARKALASSKNGLELIRAYDGVSKTYPVKRFIKEIPEYCIPKFWEDYNPSHGFDLDTFIHMVKHGEYQVTIEIFPRFQVGIPNEAFVSEIRSTHGLVDFEHTENYQHLVAGQFLYGLEKEKLGDATNRNLMNEWLEKKGLWNITDETLIGLLLNLTTLSFLERVSIKQPVLAGEAGDANNDGKLKFGYSKDTEN